MKHTENKIDQLTKFLIFIVSTTGVFGSLYFSEVLKLPPCSLCWYQRIFLYPIAILSFIDIFQSRYTDFTKEFVLAGFGILIAGYHNLLYYGFIENIVPCSQGVSCTSQQIKWFGFVTIPFLSFLAFLIILGLITFHFFSKGKTINELQ